MAKYHEQILSKGAERYIVCVPQDAFPQFLDDLAARNAELVEMDRTTWSMTDGRALVRRLTKDAMHSDDFTANWL